MNHRPGATLAAGSQLCCRLSDFRPPQVSNLQPPLTIPVFDLVGAEPAGSLAKTRGKESLYEGGVSG
jgi:hypothetical protein